VTPLYVVVRADLPSGLQIAQACHATREFGLRYPGASVGDNLVVLHAADERALGDIAERARGACLSAVFHEPDLGGAATAIALDGSAKRLLSQLPLALRAPAPT
jgi:hypothetical protein